MPAGPAFPSFAYQNVAPFGSQIVASQAALTALGTTWSTTPSSIPGGTIAPSDPGFVDTDIRLQQGLIEQRLTNLYLHALAANRAMGESDDPTALRLDILRDDIALTS